MITRTALAALAAAAALGACHRKPAPAPPPPPAAPLTFARKTATAEVAMALPRAIVLYPTLHLRLYDDGKRELAEFLKHAAEDRAKTEKPDEPAAAYERRIAWTIRTDTPRLISLSQSWYDFTGGTHPNHGSTGLLWDKQRDAVLLQSDLLRPGADYAALDSILCEAVRRARAARLGPAAAGQGDWTCPTWKSADAVLAPSTVPGRAGGLTFLFDSHALGADAQGEYEVTVPQAAFHTALAATYAPMFDGAPASRPQPKRP